MSVTLFIARSLKLYKNKVFISFRIWILFLLVLGCALFLEGFEIPALFSQAFCTKKSAGISEPFKNHAHPICSNIFCFWIKQQDNWIHFFIQLVIVVLPGKIFFFLECYVRHKIVSELSQYFALWLFTLFLTKENRIWNIHHFSGSLVFLKEKK